jgi:hypothetical protein
MPTKIIKPVDSIFAISAYLIKILQETNSMNIDNLYEHINKQYYKKITFEQFLLSLNFLFIVNQVELKNEIITIKLK